MWPIRKADITVRQSPGATDISIWAIGNTGYSHTAILMLRDQDSVVMGAGVSLRYM